MFASACGGDGAADDAEDTPSASPSTNPKTWAWLAERAGNYDGGPIVPTPESCAEIGFGPLMDELIGFNQPAKVREQGLARRGQLDCAITADKGGDTILMGASFDETASGVDAPGAPSTEKARGKVFDSPAAEAAGGVAEFERVGTGRRVRYHLPGQWVSVWVSPLLTGPFTRDEMTALLDATLLAAAGRG